MLGTIEEQVAELIEKLHGRGDGSAVALCSLTGLGVDAIPLVAAAYDREQSSERRVAIVHVLWGFRDLAALPTLAAALRDSEERVWKEALDGIVVLGGSPAVEVLQGAREDVGAFKDAVERREWVDEALEQLKEATLG